MTGRETADLIERDFELNFSEGANDITCKHCGLLFSFPRLEYTHNIAAALFAHLRSAHATLETVKTWEES